MSFDKEETIEFDFKENDVGKVSLIDFDRLKIRLQLFHRSLKLSWVKMRTRKARHGTSSTSPSNKDRAPQRKIYSAWSSSVSPIEIRRIVVLVLTLIANSSARPTLNWSPRRSWRSLVGLLIEHEREDTKQWSIQLETPRRVSKAAETEPKLTKKTPGKHWQGGIKKNKFRKLVVRLRANVPYWSEEQGRETEREKRKKESQ